MNFEVLVPPDRELQIIRSLKKLEDPYPGTGKGDKKEIKGADDVVYRLRIGDHRAFYRIERVDFKVYVFDILTSEQAHKKSIFSDMRLLMNRSSISSYYWFMYDVMQPIA